MQSDILAQLQTAASAEERDWLLLQLSLSMLDENVRTAVFTAAIPHWFDASFLTALLNGNAPDFQILTGLSFIEIFPGRGYNIHERTRHLLLNWLWQSNANHFRELSAYASAYCTGQDLQNPEWRIEWIYHLLASQPAEGIEQLRTTGLRWRNFPYNAYDQVENLARVAQEHAGRLAGQNRSWVLFWQAQVDWLYGREAEARGRLEQLATEPAQDLTLAAERSRALAVLYEQAGQTDQARSAYRQAYRHFQALGQTQTALILEQTLIDKGWLEIADSEKVVVPTVQSAAPSKSRQTLLNNIKTVWIDGMLNQSLQYEIALAMQQQPEMVGQAVSMTLHAAGQMDQTIPAGMSIHQVFEQSGGSLLILGDPGSGKTITLLQLLRALHEQAMVDTNASIPLLFNLSSWGRQQEELAEWLVEESFLQYQISRKFMREEFLPIGRYILLLDGLDEVPIARRNDCVQAINTYLAKQRRDVVVCSRIADYQTLDSTLQLDGAILLRPLTDVQIAEFLERAAPNEQTFGALRRLFQADRQTGQLARSPLLLNMMMLAYRDAHQISLGEEDRIDEKRRRLFASYIKRMLTQPPLAQERYTETQVMHWLTHLAQMMQLEGKSLFYLEEMQPTRLSQWARRSYGAMYGGLSGLISGLVVGLIIGLIIGLIVGLVGRLTNGLTDELMGGPLGMLSGVLLVGLLGGLLGGLIGGLIGMLGMALSTLISSDVQWSGVRFLISAVISGLIGVLIGVLIGGLIVGLSGLDGGLLGMLIGGLSGSGLFLSGAIVGWHQEILIRERLKFTRPSLKRLFSSVKRGLWYGLIGGLFVGLIGGLVGGLLVGLSGGLVDGLIVGLLVGLFLGLTGGLLLGLTGGLIGGLLGGLIGTVLAFIDVPSMDRRVIPGQGVRRSPLNGFLMMVAAGMLFGILTLSLDFLLILNAGLGGLFSLFIWPTLLPAAFLYYGGLAFLQHYALRMVLAAQRQLPFRLVHFLNAMTRRVLLRRVGGGYIFVHRSLLEYFAELETYTERTKVCLKWEK